MLTIDDSDRILPAVALRPNQLWTSKSEEEKLSNNRRKLYIAKYFAYIVPPYKINRDVPRIKARISQKLRIGPSFVMQSRKTPFSN